jgi:hypothetical protein
MPLLSKSQHRVRVSLIWESPRVILKGRWYKQEKFERETAWLDRAVLREKRQAEKDERVRHNADRRRIGAWLVTVSIVWATSQSAMPWWEVVSIGAAVYVGMHLAAGVTFKWW